MATLADLLRAGYVPPKESALADPIKEHIRSIPQKFEQNQADQMALLAKAYPGTTFKEMMLEGDPKANAELAMQVPFNALTAYHGTPHKILGKFDISKVGTGEGAQAYGHGMYFAENPAVAKEYQKIVQGPESTAQHYLQMYKTPEIAISALESGITSNLTAEAKKHSLDAINVLKSGKELKGNLYKVDIPDKDIPNMLAWDKPYSQQPKGVKQLIDEAIQNENFDRFEHLALAGATKQHPRSKEYVPTGQEIMNDLSTLYGIERNSPEFSNLLQSKGIKGVSYLDADSRTGIIPSNGTRNFVVFDPSTVKILEENGKALTRKEILEKELKKVVK